MNPYQIKGTAGAVINQRHRLGERTVIGSDAGCDVVVDGGGLRPRHAELRAEPGRVTLRALDGADLRVNGEAVEEIALSSGDELALGTCRWMLQAPGLRPERVLTGEAVQPRRRAWPWVVAALVLAGGAAAAAWYLGYLPWPPPGAGAPPAG
jgi:hypothetical protein